MTSRTVSGVAIVEVTVDHDRTDGHFTAVGLASGFRFDEPGQELHVGRWNCLKTPCDLVCHVAASQDYGECQRDDYD